MRFPPPRRAARLAPRLALAAASIAAVFMAAIGACILPDVRENAEAVMRDKLFEAASGAVGVTAAYARLERQGMLSREKAQAEALEGLGELSAQYGGAVYLWAAGPEGPLLEPDEPPARAQADPSLAAAASRTEREPLLVLAKDGVQGYLPDARLWQGFGDPQSGRSAFVAAFAPWDWVIAASPPPEYAPGGGNPLLDRILLVTLAALAAASGIFLFMTRLAVRADYALAKAGNDHDALTMALEESERKYRELFTNAPLGIYQTSRDGRFLAANAELARIYGFDSAKELMLDVISTPDQLYVDPADRRRLLDLLDANGRVDNFECRIRRKDGTVIWTSRNVRAAFDAEGRHLYNEGFLRDVSARVASEQATRDARDKAQAASLMKTRFLSLITHETLTPLTSILGFAKLVAKKLESVLIPRIAGADETARKHAAQALANMGVIASESERLIAIIKNALTLADLESGPALWNLAPSSAKRLAERARQNAAPLFADSSAHLRMEIAQNAPRVRCDKDKIVDALTRLLANAVKFAQKGEVVLGAREEDGMLALYVADNGPGVPPESREAVFGAFDQAGDYLTDKPSGIGLGLPIARAIAEGHGGRLRLDSVPGQGSVFTLLLPAAGPPGSEDA